MRDNSEAIWNYTRTVPNANNKGLTTVTDKVLVRVMATAEGYAMVRRKGSAPFVVALRELEPVHRLTTD